MHLSFHNYSYLFSQLLYSKQFVSMYIVHVDYIILMIGTNLAMPLQTAVMALVTQLLFVVRNEVVVTIVPCVVSVTLLSR